MDTESIRKVLDSGMGIALKEYLIGKLNELRSIDSIKDKDIATQQALEVKAQKRAYGKLKEILQEIMTLSEVVEPKDPRDSFAVGLEDEDNQ